jgi:hypothetical protein
VIVSREAAGVEFIPGAGVGPGCGCVKAECEFSRTPCQLVTIVPQGIYNGSFWYVNGPSGAARQILQLYN